MSIFTGEVKPQVICVLCYTSYSDSSKFQKIEGLKICEACSKKPTVKLEAKDHMMRAEAERVALARRIEKNRREQEMNADPPTRNILGSCFECGLTRSALTKASNGRSYCSNCLKIVQR